MASGLSVKPNGYRGTMLVLLLIASSLIELATCHKKPRLEILPAQSVQKKPIGKSLLMTCQPDVTDSSLITDLQWKDNRNLTVAPKQQEYYPKYDSMGKRLPEKAGNNSPSMYTEVLPGNQALALLIPYLTESMAGHYYCTASYASTELLDVSVVIETYVAITWKNAPENQFPILGEDFSIKCDVTASPAPSVDWIRNGDQVKTGGRYVVETHGLLIRDVQESDDGIYTCRAAVIQTGELVERNIRVEVYIKPQVIEMPKAIELVDGQPFTVKCNATGKPPPEYTWVKVQSQQNMATADRFRVNAQTGEMNILQVQKDDYGMYICRATNAAGFNDEETLLDVLVRPNIHELINVTLDHNKEGSILCKATGRPPPEITFRRWGSTEEFILGQQPEDDRITLLDNVNRERGESSATLRFDRVLRSDDGLYECIARNKGDTAYKVGHIAVQFAPTFEHMRKLPPVYSWDERKANLSCLAEGIPNATIEWRRDDRPIKDLFDKNLEIEGTGPRSNLIINPIGRQYYRSYKCIATNILGRDEIDMHLRLATIPPLIGQAIPRLITATTMTFDIVPPPIEDGMPLTAFTCSYKDERNPDWAQAIERTWSPDSPYIIEGLRPQTSYTFRFAASNLVGRGQWSAAILLATPKRSAPEQPKTLHAPADESDTVNGELLLVTSPYSDHFELRWSKPLDNGEPIDYYQIKYCLGHKVNGEWREHENQCQESEVSVAESTSYEMGGLQGDSLYRIELRAHNAIGYSEPSNLMLKTVRGVDVVLRVDRAALSSAAIVGIAVGGVILLLIFIDFMCCMIVNAGVMAALCRRSKRSPSDIDEENKLGSGQMVKEPPPSPLPLPPPVKLGGTPLTTPSEEKQPLNTPTGSIKINSSVDFDGKVVHSRSGEILGKNSSV